MEVSRYRGNYKGTRESRGKRRLPANSMFPVHEGSTSHRPRGNSRVKAAWWKDTVYELSMRQDSPFDGHLLAERQLPCTRVRVTCERVTRVHVSPSRFVSFRAKGPKKRLQSDVVGGVRGACGRCCPPSRNVAVFSFASPDPARIAEYRPVPDRCPKK
ncbi:uncharacterized protein LOC117222111 isoform X1 [Megalopta genalis]|uniref:uncharacterized protein LOC117222111 isoform X1 n=1 Tax=Megalopta genalis TaxID=115081 RepID=UPI003FD37596